jgi:AraC family transcriptional regulator
MRRFLDVWENLRRVSTYKQGRTKKGEIPPMEPDPFDTFLYESPRVTVARFRARPCDARFHDSGPTRYDCFVFPTTCVRIQHAGREPLITNPNVVAFYNRGQVYARDPVSPEGDLCDWFSVERGVLREALGMADPAAADRDDRVAPPFRLTHGPSDARTYLLQRLVVRHLQEAEQVDPLFVEETALRLLERVLGNAVRARVLPGTKPSGGAAAPDQADLVEAAEQLLVDRFRDPITLDDIVRRTGGSIFHLARLFRRRTGFPLHAYRNQLRLRAALEQAALPGVDLTDLALDLGFSSHSHFTAAFRQAFGVAPSVLRQTATGRRVRELAEKIGVPEK